MEKISIIVPCYNVEKQIDRCIDSLVGQTIGLEYLELIFVDDASTDGTMDKLTEWENRYPDNILVIHCDQNGRQGTARNIGMSYASGDYIGFVDSDDWVEPEMYEVLYRAIREHSCEVASVLFQRESEEGRILNIDRVDFSVETYVFIDSVEKRKDFLSTGLPGGIWTKLYRRIFLTKNQLYFPEKLSYEDNFFGGLLKYCLTSYVVCPQKMYHYMVNYDSSTMTSGTRHLDRLKIEMMKVEEYTKRGYMEVYHDEIERDFLKMYWCNTLALLFTRFPVTPYEVIEVMKKTVKGWFPKYLSNPYLSTKMFHETDRVFLGLLETELSHEKIEQIADMYRQAVIDSLT